MLNQESISVNHRNGNLHIALEGAFTGHTAAQLTTTMKDAYQGRGNIFIHTSKVTDIEEESPSTLSRLLGMSGLPRKNVFLMGERGKDMGSHGLRVIMPRKKHHGAGSCRNCTNCTCENRSN